MADALVGVNSYISVDDASTYMEGAVSHDAWDASDEDDQTRALISATRMLQQQPWPGQPTDPAQTLSWPRTGTGIDGVTDDVVPQPIIDAEVELAAALIADPTLYSALSTDNNISSVKAGPAAVSFFAPQQGTGRVPPQVAALLAPYLGTSGSGSGISACPTTMRDLEWDARQLSYPRGWPN